MCTISGDDWQYLAKLKIHIPFDLAISFIGRYPQNLSPCTQGKL